VLINLFVYVVEVTESIDISAASCMVL